MTETLDDELDASALIDALGAVVKDALGDIELIDVVEYGTLSGREIGSGAVVTVARYSVVDGCVFNGPMTLRVRGPAHVSNCQFIGNVQVDLEDCNIFNCFFS